MGEKYRELVKVLNEYRNFFPQLQEKMEDLGVGQAKAEELKKVLGEWKPLFQILHKLNKITSSVNAPRFQPNFLNFKLPPYPGGGLLGGSQAKQEEYRLWKKDRVLEYLIAQEEDYLKKYGQLFQGEGKAIGAWGKVKEFFKKHRKWLIPAIASTITGIIGPIIAWIVIRKLGG